MGRREDLESHIRESYGIIREYEDLVRTSDRPEEKQRARRAIEGQWALIGGYLAEYRRLGGANWPRDILEIARGIAAHFQAGSEPGPAPSREGRTTVFDQRGQQVGQQINVAGDYRAGLPPTGAPPAGGRQGSDAAAGGAGTLAGGWSRQALRQLLLAAFSDEELMALCFDHFSALYAELAPAMSKGEKVHRLLEHCIRHGKVDTLLDLVKRQNAVQYERFRPRKEENE